MKGLPQGRYTKEFREEALDCPEIIIEAIRLKSFTEG